MSHQEAVLFSHSVSCSHPPADIHTQLSAVTPLVFSSDDERIYSLITDNAPEGSSH